MRLGREIALISMVWASVAMAVGKIPCGDSAFRLRRDPAKAREALACYREAHKLDPESVEVAWRLAMACQFVGFRLARDTDEKLALFAEGRDAATAASKKDPACGPCHFWAGIDRALYGETSGIFRTIATLGIVRENLARAAELDASYAFGGPDRVLGLIGQKVPGILGGSNRRAEEHFEKAIASAPRNPLNYLFLAKFYRETMDDKLKYRETLERARLKVVAPPVEEVESFEAWEELGEWTRKPSSKEVADTAESVQR